VRSIFGQSQAQQPAKILQASYRDRKRLRFCAWRPFWPGLEAADLRAADQVTLIPAVTGGDSAQLGSLAADLVARKVDHRSFGDFGALQDFCSQDALLTHEG
jgi:hypothetical protein